MDKNLAATLIMNFYVAFGVLVGGSLIGGIGAFLTGHPPLDQIHELALKLKIWAIVAAIGGTFDTFISIERGIFEGTHGDVAKTLMMVFSALCGAQTGTLIIQWLTQEQFR